MMDQDPIDEAVRAYQVPAPPADLAARVASQILAGEKGAGGQRAGGDPPGRRWRGGLSVVAMIGAAAAIAVPSILLLRSDRGLRPGASAPAARETIRLGDRAILVAEGGSVVRWWPGTAGALLVEQTRGDVFYRVDAGPLTVETPLGTVRVLGTCFRVEVTDMKLNRQTLAGAAAGAALASAVLVTVYEGRVSLASSGGRIEVPAGETALLPGDQPPRRLGPAEKPGHARSAPPAFQPAPAAPPTAPAMDELATLRARVVEQEKEIARLRTNHPHAREEKDYQRFIDPPPEELQERARRCEIAFVTPNLDGPDPVTMSPKQARELGLSDTEREAVDEVMKETHTSVPTELRKLYLEMGGDPTTADRLSASTLLGEIVQKTPGDQVTQVRIRLSRERAGLLAPSPNPAAAPVERALRLMHGLADDFERRLGERIGPERAASLKNMRRNWGNHSSMGGCPNSSE